MKTVRRHQELPVSLSVPSRLRFSTYGIKWSRRHTKTHQPTCVSLLSTPIFNTLEYSVCEDRGWSGEWLGSGQGGESFFIFYFYFLLFAYCLFYSHTIQTTYHSTRTYTLGLFSSNTNISLGIYFANYFYVSMDVCVLDYIVYAHAYTHYASAREKRTNDRIHRTVAAFTHLPELPSLLIL